MTYDSDEFDDVEFDESVIHHINDVETHYAAKGKAEVIPSDQNTKGYTPSKSHNISYNRSISSHSSSIRHLSSDMSHQKEKSGIADAGNRSSLPHSSSGNSDCERGSNYAQNRLTRQYNLFGEMLPEPTQGVFIQARNANGAVATSQTNVQTDRNGTLQPSHKERHCVSEDAKHCLFPPMQRNRTKQWDFAQPIIAKRPVSIPLDDEFFPDDEELDVAEEFEQPPPPATSHIVTPKTMKLKVDREAIKTWIYPINKEKRDYQYNIVQRALFNNVLVALPTGLGKTFIAAVVILNYFRWFPEGKIVFVAPSKPLVAQQQQACHEICGLPWDTATEMTGEMKVARRAEEWKSKRIFYMTPQTFENDLCSDIVSTDDIVCVVVDEAHHATGNYAYAKVIRHLMPRNPFFRVLALTATPGSRPEQVQQVVDSLHINLIEIRQEDALDIRGYIRTKEEDPVVVPLGGIVAKLRDMLAKVMKPSIDVLSSAGLLNTKDAVGIAPYALQMMYKHPQKRDIISKRKLYTHVSDLGTLARAMEYLIKYSVLMFAERMFSLEAGANDGTAKGKGNATRQKRKFSGNPIIRDMKDTIRSAQDSDGVIIHPKMEYLQNVIAAHFANEAEHGRDTRVMVFCSYRECVNEIVTILNRVHTVKAEIFVGQASDSKGNRGLRQKDQERIVSNFKQGLFNVLVSTSIGEEGLDIGEVDLIVNYEAIRSSTRMLQRDGRTGRKRAGRVVTLMSEGPEEKNWQISKDNYKNVQNDILKGVTLSLFDDVERLIPDDITSVPVFEEVDQPPFEPSMIKMNAKKGRKDPEVRKRKRDSDPQRNIPRDGQKGFVKVSDMRRSQGKRPQRNSLREGADEPESCVFKQASAKELQPDNNISPQDSEDEDIMLSKGLILDDTSLLSHDSTNSSLARSVLPSDLHNSENDCAKESQRPQLPIQSSSNVKNALSTSQGASSTPSSFGTSSVGLHDHSSAQRFSILGSSSHRPGNPHPLVLQLAAETDDIEQMAAPESLSMLPANPSSSPLVAPGRRKKAHRVVNLSSSPLSEKPTVKARYGSVTNNVHSDQPDQADVKKKNKRGKGKKTIGASPTSRRLFRFEADLSSGGEGWEDDEDSEQCMENSSDREHVGDFEPTQAPLGYNQKAMYMQSLLSQNCLTPFRQQVHLRSRSPLRQIQDTPRADGSSSGIVDEYERGSFICSDDEPILYETQSTAIGM